MGRNSEGYDLDDPSTWGGDGGSGERGGRLGGLLRRKAGKKAPLPRFCWRAAVAEHSCDCMTGCKIPASERR